MTDFNVGWAVPAMYPLSGTSGGHSPAHGARRMRRTATVTLSVLILVYWLLSSGCDQPQVQAPIAGPAAEPPVAGPTDNQEAAPAEPAPATAPAGFGIARIGILPLTQLAPQTAGGQTASLTVYVGLLDAFGCPIKAPGLLRFELYRYVPRSARPTGERITIWPDIDLTRPAENNACWRDYLRAYEFKLDVPAGLPETCILGVTCIGSDGKRFTTEFPLRTGP